jgi:hypothetical protein
MPTRGNAFRIPIQGTANLLIRPVEVVACLASPRLGCVLTVALQLVDSMARIAIDRGGTFTDVICSRKDEDDIVFKVSTPSQVEFSSACS